MPVHCSHPEAYDAPKGSVPVFCEPLFRENPAVPGPDTCTQRRSYRIYTGVGFNQR